MASSDSTSSSNSKELELAHDRWAGFWNQGLAPGTMWDKETPCPALLKYIADGKIPNGRALVPGCGRGYDVAALASKDRFTLGIDLVPIAVAAAKNWYESLPAELREHQHNAQFQTLNFFELPIDEANKFDFIYDYTFLCALDPSIRVDWAKKMSELIRPGGILLTLVFPIQSPDIITGPPFTVSLDIVKNLMADFECLELYDLPSELSHAGREGSGPTSATSGLGLWRRK